MSSFESELCHGQLRLMIPLHFDWFIQSSDHDQDNTMLQNDHCTSLPLHVAIAVYF